MEDILTQMVLPKYSRRCTAIINCIIVRAIQYLIQCESCYQTAHKDNVQAIASFGYRRQHIVEEVTRRSLADLGRVIFFAKT